MKIPLTEEAFKEREGETFFTHDVRKHATMAALETALRSIVENSFYGATTGYQHVQLRRITEAETLLNSLENSQDR